MNTNNKNEQRTGKRKCIKNKVNNLHIRGGNDKRRILNNVHFHPTRREIERLGSQEKCEDRNKDSLRS